MRKAPALVIALTASLSVILSAAAEGHCHRAKCPAPCYSGCFVYSSFCYGGCDGGGGYGGCGSGGCGWGGCGSGGCGAGRCGSAGCGVGGCGAGGCGSAACRAGGCGGCHLKHHFKHACCLRRQCGGGCGSGCGIASGGCDSCGSSSSAGCGCTSVSDGGAQALQTSGQEINSTSGIELNSTIISDRPAEPASGAVEPTQIHETSHRQATPYRLVSEERQDGSGAFDRGMGLLRSRSLTEAVGAFDMAAKAEPNNPLYRYFLALTIYDLNGGDSLTQAIELERQSPVSGWGKKMERVQGKSRNWIEKARRDAGLVR
jgi:hypothetical protein